MNPRRVFIDVLIAMFGIAAWIGVNGIWVQLPLLVASAPEGWSLPAHIVVVIQAANLGPMFYTLCRRFVPKLCNDSAWISSLLVVGSTAMGLLAYLYDKRMEVSGAEHSIALLILVFATALVGCSSSVLFVPYLRNFHEAHLISFFIGEGLSGLFSSAIALFQGVGGNPVCQKNTSNSSESQPPVISSPNFSPKIYFSLIFVILVSCTCAFWLLNYLPAIRNRRISSLNEVAQESNRPDEHSATEKMISTDLNETIDRESPTPSMYSSNIMGYLYALMGFICFASNGFLPGMQSYSCLPYGNIAYYLTVTLANLSIPIACTLPFWLPSPRLRGINMVSALAVVGACYVTWLAFSSPTPPWRDTTLGVVLVVLAWILVSGTIAYVKLSITAIFRQQPGNKALFLLGIVTQTGSATGAIFSFILTNYSNLLISYNGCDPTRQ